MTQTSGEYDKETKEILMKNCLFSPGGTRPYEIRRRIEGLVSKEETWKGWKKSIGTNQKVLGELLFKVLVYDGVLSPQATPSGPELMLAAESYLDHTSDGCRKCEGGQISMMCNFCPHCGAAQTK